MTRTKPAQQRRAELLAAGRALFLAKGSSYGVAEVGRVADLVLLDANPLEDIGNTRKIFGVVVGGKYYSRGALNKMLEQVENLAAQE